MATLRAFSPWTAAAAGLLGAALTIAAAEPASRAAEVDVVLTDYNIQMNNILQAGATTFKLRNNGKVEHGFAVRSGTVTSDTPKDLASLKTPLAPGAETTLHANLPAGTYEVVDPLKDHKDRGMSLRVRVQDKTIPEPMNRD